MNTTPPSEAELERIEADYLRLKPLRELESIMHGLTRPAWKNTGSPVVVTALCGFIAAMSGAENLLPFFTAVAAALTWQMHFIMEDRKRFELSVTSLRALANLVAEQQKKQA